MNFRIESVEFFFKFAMFQSAFMNIRLTFTVCDVSIHFEDDRSNNLFIELNFRLKKSKKKNDLELKK